MPSKTHDQEVTEAVKDTINITAAEATKATDKVADNVEKVAAKASDAVDSVEVKVNEVISSASHSTTWMLDNMRRMLLASVGAVAMTIDEAEGLVSKMVDRGELAQKDGQKLIKQMRSRLDPRRDKVESEFDHQVEKVSDRLEQGMEDMLGRLNIPTKRDIDDLSAKIAQLSVRIEELTKKSK